MTQKIFDEQKTIPFTQEHIPLANCSLPYQLMALADLFPFSTIQHIDNRGFRIMLYYPYKHKSNIKTKSIRNLDNPFDLYKEHWIGKSTKILFYPSDVRDGYCFIAIETNRFTPGSKEMLPIYSHIVKVHTNKSLNDYITKAFEVIL